MDLALVADTATSTVVLAGELDLATAHLLTEAIGLLPGPTVTVEVSELTFIDSSGVAALALAWREGRTIRVVGASELVARVLTIAGFDDWLT